MCIRDRPLQGAITITSKSFLGPIGSAASILVMKMCIRDRLTTVMTYWSSVIKATRMLGTSEEQGRLFGLQEGLRGFINAGLVFAMTAVFANYTNNILGAAWAIRFCAFELIIVGILCFLFISGKQDDQKSEPLKEDVYKRQPKDTPSNVSSQARFSSLVRGSGFSVKRSSQIPSAKTSI